MTPLINIAQNITPAQGVIGSFFGAVVVPELAALYNVPDGAVPLNLNYNGNGIPIAGPIFRAITEYSYSIEAGAGITAGHLALYALRLDGNWHQAANSNLAPVPNTNYYGSVRSGVALGSLANAYGTPLLGIALGFIQFALAGGNLNYLEISARAKEIDPATIFGSRTGVLIT